MLGRAPLLSRHQISFTACRIVLLLPKCRFACTAPSSSADLVGVELHFAPKAASHVTSNTLMAACTC